MAAEMEAAQLRPLSLPTPVRVPTVFFFGGGGNATTFDGLMNGSGLWNGNRNRKNA
jgi:hypothetical protein